MVLRKSQKNLPKKNALILFFEIFLILLVITNNSIRISVAQPTKTEIKVGVFRDLPPLEYEENNAPEGFLIKLMDELGRIGNFNIKYAFIEGIEVYASLQNGSVDCAFYQITQERQNIMDYSAPVLNVTYNIYVTKEVIGIADIYDLKNHTVAILSDFNSGSYLRTKVPEALFVEVDNAEEGLRLLSNGEVFAFFGEGHYIQYTLQKKPNTEIKQIGEPIPRSRVGIAVKKGNSAVLSIINQSLDTLFASGQYEKLFTQWFGTNVNQGLDPEIQNFLMYTGLVLIIGICGSVLWNYTLSRKLKIKTQEIEEKNLLFRQILESAPYPIISLNGTREIDYFNPSFYRLFGYSREELKNIEDFLNYCVANPEERKKMLVEWDEAIKKSFSEHPIIRIYEVVNKFGIKLQVEFQLIFINNQKSFVILNNLTEQQKIEEQKLRDQRIESMQLISGGIAHDLNNILMGILGNVNLIQLEEGIEKIQPQLGQLEKAILRAKGFSNQLFTFSNVASIIKKPTDIVPLVQDCAEFIMHGSNCGYEIIHSEHLPLADIDANQISQVIQNLLLNGIQAMPGGGKITIKIQPQDISEKSKLNLAAGKYICITVSDQGTGIDPKNYDKIFNPYFTTKKDGKGLGLASLYAIIKNHGGMTTFESKLGVGTSFFIYLPASQKKEMEKIDQSIAIRKLTGKLLIMDDDVDNVKIIQAILQKEGLSTDIVFDGEAMIEAYMDARQKNQPYNLVIMDLTVREKMGGLEAMKILRQKDPTIKAILASGYTSSPIFSEYQQYGFLGILKKPYNVSELNAEIVRILSPPNSTP